MVTPWSIRSNDLWCLRWKPCLKILNGEMLTRTRPQCVSNFSCCFPSSHLTIIEVEEQRRYLGGDGQHSILVKGLDMALLEQNKARVGLSTEDDDSLEQAFLEVASESKVQKKKTREDLIRDLKEKRQKGEVDAVKKVATAEDDIRRLEEAKKVGKFKPIGAPTDDKSKRKREKEKGKDGEKKKKRRKAEGVNTQVETKVASTDALEATQVSQGQHPAPPPAPPAQVAPPQSIDPPETDPIDGDFDIFAGAGEYEGFVLDDDDDEAATTHVDNSHEANGLPGDTPAVGQWIDVEEREKFQPSLSPDKAVPPPFLPKIAKPNHEEGEEEDGELPSRLVPLESSALPSIKDFLALGEAVESKEKRQKRKEKRKGAKGNEPGEKKKLSADAKVERDYKKYVEAAGGVSQAHDHFIRLQSYTGKKAGA